MKTADRIKDILKTDNFNSTEIIHENRHFFKSIEYYLIVHLTNEELNYLDEHTEETYNSADYIEETPQGKIFCFS